VVTGRVLYGPTGRPAVRTWVVLHQVSMGGGGQPIDSTRTDARGAYALTIRRPDSATIYVVSTWYAGIAYFSEPITPGRSSSSLRPLYVYDTSSTGPPVRVTRRLITVAREKRDGSRDVLELVELENPGVATRVARDTLLPTWAGAIPPVVVTRRGDSVAVYGPLPPRERKQLSYTYVLSATVRRVSVPIDQATDEVDLLLEDTAGVVTAAKLDSLGPEDIGGRRFARYRTPPLAPGAGLTITFSDRRLAPESLVPFIVGLAGVVLAVAFVVALRRKPR